MISSSFSCRTIVAAAQASCTTTTPKLSSANDRTVELTHWSVKIPETIHDVYTNEILFTEDHNDSSTFEINSKEIDSIEDLESNLNKGLDNVITSQKVKNNINYKVQILAGHKIISQNYLSNKFKFKENYSIESHGGWLKYTVGDNTKYSEARDNRNELDKYNFPGPFVIAYNYDKRVTVQEALILTNQNWTP